MREYATRQFLDSSFWPSWSQQFLSLGGYSALLTRLNEILEVEWRLVMFIDCGLTPN
jgi:hypothetical protein